MLRRCCGSGAPGRLPEDKRDLEFIEFVPLGIRAIAIGDGQQLLHALAR